MLMRIGLLVFASALLLGFSFPAVVYGTSGCCSGKHGGVDCSAGPQSNGHLICADGWRGSSCLFSANCDGSYTAPATKPVATKAPVIAPTPTASPTPSIAPTSTPPATIEPTPQVQGASNSNGNILGELVGVGITGFLGWKALKFLGRKAANV